MTAAKPSTLQLCELASPVGWEWDGGAALA
jgi:hypothetical protein